MIDDDKPEAIADAELEQAQGGITLDNGIKKPSGLKIDGDGGADPSGRGKGGIVGGPTVKGMERVFEDE